MSQEKPYRHNRPRRASVSFEEDKAWIAFYRRVGDPSVAAELLQHLDSDADMKRAHPALYLRCKETLRSHKARQARAKRIGHFVRTALGASIRIPWSAIRKMSLCVRDIAVECLPETRSEPAIGRVKRLTKNPGFAKERQAFSDQDTNERA